jgi:hypothetical protein
VRKDFIPDAAGVNVSVSLACLDGLTQNGTVSPGGSVTVSEGLPGMFTVTNFTGDPTCIATESPIPAGYTSTGQCQAPLSFGMCTITNKNACPSDDPDGQHTPTNNTPPGNPVTLEFHPDEAQAIRYPQKVTITWPGAPPVGPQGQVTGEGRTCVKFTAAPPAPEPPEGFKVVGSGVYKLFFEIGTTAQWEGVARICVEYLGGSVSPQDAEVYFYHFDHFLTDWTRIGTDAGAGSTRTICGDVSQYGGAGGFSPFVVVQAEPVGGLVEVPVTADGSAAPVSPIAAAVVVMAVLATGIGLGRLRQPRT